METPSRVLGPVTGSLDIIELPFYYLGLNTVTKRFMFGAVATGALLYGIKPTALFDADGTPRSWSLTNNDPASTYVPWWVYSLGAGIVLATFV